jgi:hypothetical protein
MMIELWRETSLGTVAAHRGFVSASDVDSSGGPACGIVCIFIGRDKVKCAETPVLLHPQICIFS